MNFIRLSDSNLLIDFVLHFCCFLLDAGLIMRRFLGEAQTHQWIIDS